MTTLPKQSLPLLGIDPRDNRLVDEKEAARVLGLSVRTMQQRRYLGQEPYPVQLPDSRAIRYWLPSLYEYIGRGFKLFGEADI
ncbi:hypothetical protein KL86DPRO_20532 [uncultured delta proteobacterium]|uniref:DNA-binding protein n=1 Tax=uncultured delta proteobacterium TaxID=34034 RepID=A0A212K1W3_9DELT|nr:hypothetical protein KL86DPRO_20532 [uncultured delta proteobacterium]